MSQGEFFDLQAKMSAYTELISGLSEKDLALDAQNDFDQMRFIISLYPGGPMAGFLQALDTLHYGRP